MKMHAKKAHMHMFIRHLYQHGLVRLKFITSTAYVGLHSPYLVSFLLPHISMPKHSLQKGKANHILDFRKGEVLSKAL